MKQFIETTNEDGLRLYINVNHILSVSETGENRCMIITDLPPTRDSIVPFYYTVNEPYEVIKSLIVSTGGEE